MFATLMMMSAVMGKGELGVVPANMCCSDGCGTDGWQPWTTKAKYCPMACGYCYDATLESGRQARLNVYSALANSWMGVEDADVFDDQTLTPTKTETPSPTKAETASPTKAETASPTKAQTASPTKAQTASPTKAQTASPTKAETASPTKAETASPTKAQTASPTKAQTASPTSPTVAPTPGSPTMMPTLVDFAHSKQRKDDILLTIIGVCILAFGCIVCAGCKYKNRNSQSGDPYKALGNDWA